MALPGPRSHDSLQQRGSYLHGLNVLQSEIVEIDAVHVSQERARNIKEGSVRQASNRCARDFFSLGRRQTGQTKSEEFEKGIVPFCRTAVCVLILLQFRSIRDKRPSAIRFDDIAQPALALRLRVAGDAQGWEEIAAIRARPAFLSTTPAPRRWHLSPFA